MDISPGGPQGVRLSHCVAGPALGERGGGRKTVRRGCIIARWQSSNFPVSHESRVGIRTQAPRPQARPLHGTGLSLGPQASSSRGKCF